MHIRLSVKWVKFNTFPISYKRFNLLKLTNKYMIKFTGDKVGTGELISDVPMYWE